MKKIIIVFVLFAALLQIGAIANADGVSNLTLTEAEMQKLKKYFPEEETSHLVWNGNPILIKVPLSDEKRIVFPSRVTVDINGALNSGQLRAITNENSLYLTALKPFEKTRIYASLPNQNVVIIIDLVTDETISNDTQYIDLKKNEPNHLATTTSAVSNQEEVESENLDSNSEDINFVTLIRSAWKEIYAPERLLKNSTHLARVPMHTEVFVPDLVYGDKVIAHPISSWTAGEHYVTAIALQNKYPHPSQINPQKDICGDWEAATIYPSSHLKPYGQKTGDSATLFLVSQKPFSETVGVCHGNA